MTQVRLKLPLGCGFLAGAFVEAHADSWVGRKERALGAEDCEGVAFGKNKLSLCAYPGQDKPRGRYTCGSRNDLPWLTETIPADSEASPRLQDLWEPDPWASQWGQVLPLVLCIPPQPQRSPAGRTRSFVPQLQTLHGYTVRFCSILGFAVVAKAKRKPVGWALTSSPRGGLSCSAGDTQSSARRGSLETQGPKIRGHLLGAGCCGRPPRGRTDGGCR